MGNRNSRNKVKKQSETECINLSEIPILTSELQNIYAVDIDLSHSLKETIYLKQREE